MTTNTESHNFEKTTFKKPTFCDLCSNFIWGVGFKQGHTCTGCGFNTHKRCTPLVVTQCHPIEKNYERKIGEISRNDVDASSINSVTESLGKSSVLTELFVETTKQSKSLANMAAEVNPSLSMFNFIKQNNRFSARQKPMIWAQDRLIKLVSWHDPQTTLTFLAIYVTLCLNPMLFLVTPQLILLYVMSKLYMNRANKIAAGEPLPAPHKYGEPPVIDPSASELKEAFQNIQNTMANISDAYDTGYNFYRMIDFSDPKRSKQIFYGTVGSIFATFVVPYIIPLNYILLVGGVIGLFAVNPVFRAATTLAPVIADRYLKSAAQNSDLILAAKKSGRKAVIPIEIFENQRWWAGAGWIQTFFAGERKGWTDVTGTIKFPSKDSYNPPTVKDITGLSDENCPKGRMEWIEEYWGLDENWQPCDAKGWQYSDNLWTSQSGRRGLGSFTRRRKWIRHLTFIEDEKDK